MHCISSSSLICCLLSLAAISTASPASSQHAYIVHTSNGPIQGHQAADHPQVKEYLGIPYAQPPLGSLRFAPPQKYQGDSKKLFAAAAFSDSCPASPGKPVDYPDSTPQQRRIIAITAQQTGDPQSEDCLKLNVWAKKRGNVAKPVLIFFHGGAWSIGETKSPFYNGKYLADAEDVIVVTLDFRQNIFGFPGAPNETQNLGLLDQRLAVQWVRDNIHAFGGDKSKIVIFGQSSGAVAVDYWSYAYPEDPIASGLVLLSGNAFSFPTNPRDLMEQHWYTVSDSLGCGSFGDVMPCMRRQNFSAIEAATTKVKPPPGGSVTRPQPAFQPTPDGIVVFDDYDVRSRTGKFARIPLFLGNPNNDAGYYKLVLSGQGVTLPESTWEDFNLQDFTCPTAKEAAARVQFGVPIWRYRYFGDWPNVRLYPTSGAYHTTDLELVFGTSQDVSGLLETSDQLKLQALVQKAIVAFASDPKAGLKKELGWPRYEPKGNTLIRLGYENSPIPSFVAPALYDARCPQLNTTGSGASFES